MVHVSINPNVYAANLTEEDLLSDCRHKQMD